MKTCNNLPRAAKPCSSSFPTVIVLAAAFVNSTLASPVSGPLPPKDALKSFQFDPGLKVELVAAEPLVADPVAVCFDDRGRLYVAENRDYPTGPATGEKPSGTIALLEDTDGDGRADQRTEFVTGLTFPNGVMPWNGGLIVTCAPDVLYFKDTDGDGRADVRKVLFTGFNTGGSTQLRVSHPTLGADGWIYLTSGWTGPNKVSCPEHPERPAQEFRSDCRFDPLTLELVPEDSRAQFGLTFDDFGHRFICYNRVHIQHVVLPGTYLKRNPHLPFSKTVQDVPENRVRDWLANEEGFAARTYPISDNVTTYDSHAGTFSAACSVHVYSGDALPPDCYGDVFACDPTGNLVHRDELRQKGPTFGSHMVHEGREFLASTDNWFRPVFLADGPDGALYVCDMYRKTIEHPDYLPPETRRHADFRSGRGMGRIWRVTAATAKARPVRPSDFASAAQSKLIRSLTRENGWARSTAQRLLLERRSAGQNVTKGLRNLVLNEKTAAASRYLAMNLLETFGSLDEATLCSAMKAPAAGLREGAARLAEKRLDSRRVFSALLKLAEDDDPRVRFQCALSLGALSGSETIPALARLSVHDGEDEWSRAAILSSVPDRAGLLLENVLQSTPLPDPEFLTQLGQLAGRESSDPAGLMKNTLSANSSTLNGAARVALVEGILSGSGREKANKILLPDLKPVLLESDKLVQDSAQPLPVRKVALALLSRNGKDSGERILTLIDPRQPSELQQAAVRALARQPRSSAAIELLQTDRWRTLSSALHATVIGSFMAEPRATAALLSAVEAGRIPSNAFTARQREQLRKHSDPVLQKKAQELFAATGGDRMKVYEESKSILELPANPENGRAVFARTCATCHRLEQQGVTVGPELVAIRHQPKEAILLHVINPNYEVAPAFAAYELETKEGRTLTGLIASESPSSITLREAQGIEETVQRSEIKRFAASSLSLMPDELEKTMSRQELADLIAFLKGEKQGEK